MRVNMSHDHHQPVQVLRRGGEKVNPALARELSPESAHVCTSFLGAEHGLRLTVLDRIVASPQIAGRVLDIVSSLKAVLRTGSLSGVGCVIGFEITRCTGLVRGDVAS
jgi:hypothetical protein